MLDISAQTISNRGLYGSDRSSLFEISKWIVVIALIVGTQLTAASIRKEILMMSYQLEQLRRSNVELDEANDLLRVEYNSLATPGEIERVGKELGLISSNHQDVMILEGERLSASRNQLAQVQTQAEVIHE